MSVSVNDAPLDISPSTRAIYWDIESDRVDVLSYSVNDVVNNGGNAQYGLVVVHHVQVGDVVEVTNVDADYNGKQTVISVNPKSFTTDKTFTVYKGAGGSLERINANFRMKADIYKGDLDENTITFVADESGSARFTLSDTPTMSPGDKVAISGNNLSYTSINAIADNNGKVQYNLGSNLIPVGAVVVVSGVTVESTYNGTQRVIANSGTLVTTDRNFVTSSGATAGQLDYAVYDGVHTVVNVISNDIITDATYVVPVTTGKVIGVSLLGSKFQQEITDNGTDLFRMNVANLIDSALSFDLATIGGTAIISPNTGSISNYSVTFTEQFDGADGLRKDGLAIQSAVDKKAINVALQHNQVQNLNAFTVNNDTKRFLTYQPTVNFIGDTDQNERYKVGDILQLHFLHTGALQVEGRIEEYDDAFSLTTPIYTTGLTDISIQRGIFRVDTSTFQAATTLVVLKLQDSGLAVISENYAFVLDTKCYPDAKRFVWLNRLGGFDAYWFNQNLTERITTDKSEYQRGLSKGWTYSDRGDAVIGSKSFEEYEIWSDWLNDGQKQWLKELFTSKYVYLVEEIDGTDEYIPVIITDSSQIMRKSDDMTQIRLRYRTPELVING